MLNKNILLEDISWIHSTLYDTDLRYKSSQPLSVFNTFVVIYTPYTIILSNMNTHGQKKDELALRAEPTHRGMTRCTRQIPINPKKVGILNECIERRSFDIDTIFNIEFSKSNATMLKEIKIKVCLV